MNKNSRKKITYIISAIFVFLALSCKAASAAPTNVTITYNPATSNLTATWGAVPANWYQWGFGPYPNWCCGNELNGAATANGSVTSASWTRTLSEGRYTFAIEACDPVNCLTNDYAYAYLVYDITAPTCTVTALPAYKDFETFTVSWSGTDAVAGIANYSVQYSDNGGAWTDWQTAVTTTSASFSGVDLHTYGFRCFAVDNSGNSGTYPGTANTSTTVDAIIGTTITGMADGSSGADLAYQNTASSLSAHWNEVITDNLHEYAVGTTSGGSDVVTWTALGAIGAANFTVSGLSLTNGTTYYFSIRSASTTGRKGAAFSTDGVRVDVTPPSCSLSGYTCTYPASFAVAWDGSDNIGIANYEIEQQLNSDGWTSWQTSNTNTSAFFDNPLSPNTYSFRCRTTDNAGNVGDWSTTHSVVVDGEGPAFAFVNDGGGADEDFTNVTSQLSANWAAADVGCYGLKQYLYRIGTTPGGNDIVVNWNNNTSTSVTRAGLGLTDGTTYYFTIVGIDFANYSTEYTSDGITVDTSPPTPSFTSPSTEFVGTTSFNIEWTADDGANGSGNANSYNIQYRDGTGAWTDYWGGALPTSDTFSTFTGVDGHTYDFRITARDNIGNWSSYPVSPDYNLRVSIYSSRPDAPAVVYDGTTTGTDVDITNSNSGFSASWDAVTVSGGAVYAYAVGTTSGGNDIVDWTETTDTFVDLPSASYSDGTYYVSVKTRTITNIWSLSSTSSDGIVIDTNPPTCTVSSLDAWQVFSSSFSVSWSGSDATTGVASYDVQYQDNGGGWTDWLTGQIGVSGTLNGINGHSYEFQCRATDDAGNVSAYPGSAQASTSVDTSGPSVTYVYDGTGADESLSISANTLSANWTGADSESGIQRYEYAIGTTSGGSDVLGWTNVNLDVSVTNSSLSLSNATTYYVSVRAYNNAGLASDLSSNGILVDLAAPTTSMSKPSSTYSSTADILVVWSGADGAGESGLKEYYPQYKQDNGAWTDWSPSPTTDVSRTFNGADNHTYYFRVAASDNAGNIGAYPVSPDYQATTIVDTTLLPAPANIFDGVTSGADVDYTTTNDALSGYWDAVSGATEYAYSVGSTPGGSDVITRTTTTDTFFTASGLSLTDGAAYYISVEAKNLSGLWGSSGNSDGIRIDRTAPTCSVASLSAWQSKSTLFTVSWSGSDGTSGVSNYGVQVQDDNGGWTDWRTADAGTSGTYAGVDGHAYQFRCRATDALGNVGDWPASAQASTSVDTTPPSISFVNDGAGADESLTISGSSLAGNWAGADSESGIERYEYAVGSSSGGTDIVDWTINGTNTSVTLSGLSLSNAVTYYLSVRAYNAAGLLVSLTSDGILADLQPPSAQFTSPTSEFIGSESFTVEWEGADGAGESGLKEFTLQYRQGSGNWTDWSVSPTTDTSRVFTGVDGETYFFRIKAQDIAGNLGSYPISPEYQLKVTIDLTKPSAPSRVVDGSGATDADYASSATTLSGRWDAVEGAAEYAYAVGTLPGEADVVDWTSTLETSFTKTGLSLTGGKKYFVSVRMKNNLGVWSSPASSDGIIVDVTAPVTPVVKDEGDITSDAANLKFTLETSDKESPLTKIFYAIGTAPDKTDVRDWTDIGLQTSLTASGLSLSPGTRYYILVKAENAAGLTSKIGASNGINRVVGSLITFSYLPMELSVKAGSGEDVQAPIEMIIKENGGSKVIYTQLKRSFSLPGGMKIEDPVTSVNLTVQANEEQRLKTVVTIPGRIVTVAMGGVTRASVNVELNYIGTDSGGNAVSSMFRIPATLTASDAGELFTLGEIKITAPLAGQAVGSSVEAKATVSVSGVGTLKGKWVLNGQSGETFSMDVLEGGKVELTQNFAPLLEGDNKLSLIITSPEYRESKELKFKGTSASQTKITELWSGKERISEVNLKFDSKNNKYSGEGKVKLPFTDQFITVPFKNITLTSKDGKNVISGAALAEVTDYKIVRGPVVIQADTLLFTANGIAADGKITIKSADGVPGIGPLYFYGVDISENGMSGKVRLDSPQKGKLGVFAMEVNGLTFSLSSTGATVNTNGNLLVSKRQVIMNKRVVIETTPEGGLRFGNPR